MTGPRTPGCWRTPEGGFCGRRGRWPIVQRTGGCLQGRSSRTASTGVLGGDAWSSVLVTPALWSRVATKQPPPPEPDDRCLLSEGGSENRPDEAATTRRRPDLRLSERSWGNEATNKKSTAVEGLSNSIWRRACRTMTLDATTCRLVRVRCSVLAQTQKSGAMC